MCALWHNGQQELVVGLVGLQKERYFGMQLHMNYVFVMGVMT
jgi:hypothetical protein